MANDSMTKRSWYKHWWGVLIIVILVLIGGGIGYFGSQVAQFYGMIERDEISDADLAYLHQFTVSGGIQERFENTPVVDAPVETTDDPQFGNLNAPLVIVEFADFGCPWSREESFIIRELATKYADRVSYIYRDFPLDDLHPDARLAAEAGECAAELGNFWAFHDKLYQNQQNLSYDDLIGYAREVGLPEDAFVTCVDEGRYAAEVQQDFIDGVRAGVRGTPTFFLNGRRVEGAIPRDIFEEIMKAVTS
jgi:protein-disulfide isomerase